MIMLLEPSLSPSDGADSAVLDRLQLQVARRADAIARRIGGRREQQRAIWLRAELEVFENAERAGLRRHPFVTHVTAA
jgi:hypothetical protein